jgi:hypothetical protein
MTSTTASKWPSDVEVTEYGPDLTVITVHWKHYSVHLQFFIPPTAGEINEAITVGRLRLNNIQRDVDAVTRRLGK